MKNKFRIIKTERGYFPQVKKWFKWRSIYWRFNPVGNIVALSSLKKFYLDDNLSVEFDSIEQCEKVINEYQKSLSPLIYEIVKPAFEI